MDDQSWVRLLQAQAIGVVRQQVSLSPLTTWRMGGCADVWVEVSSAEALARLRALAQEYGQRLTVLGRGSNVLIADEGVRGTVVTLTQGVTEIEQDDNVIRVGAGHSLIRLAAVAARWGLSGLEFAGGIPGSVGGAVYMNAGAHGSDIGQIVHTVTGIDALGAVHRWDRASCRFGYRQSVFQQQDVIITQVTLQLTEGDRKHMAGVMATHKERRLRTQPLQLACAGSVFRNPPGEYAARLIEDAGLKGLCIGGAQVSPLHANFLINIGQATAAEMVQLIQCVRQRVHTRYGIWLEPEVRGIGKDGENWLATAITEG